MCDRVDKPSRYRWGEWGKHAAHWPGAGLYCGQREVMTGARESLLGPSYFRHRSLIGKSRGRPVQRVELVYRPAGHLAGCLLAALALALAAVSWCPPPRI